MAILVGNIWDQACSFCPPKKDTVRTKRLPDPCVAEWKAVVFIFFRTASHFYPPVSSNVAAKSPKNSSMIFKPPCFFHCHGCCRGYLQWCGCWAIVTKGVWLSNIFPTLRVHQSSPLSNGFRILKLYITLWTLWKSNFHICPTGVAPVFFPKLEFHPGSPGVWWRSWASCAAAWPRRLGDPGGYNISIYPLGSLGYYQEKNTWGLPSGN